MDLLERPDHLIRRHPWELARAAFFRGIVHAHAGATAMRCLDVGCGDSWLAGEFLKQLPSGSTIVGWDTELNEELIHLFQAELPAQIRLMSHEPDGTFDFIFCMDVIEHVEDDEGLLNLLVNQYLSPGGRLLCSVPAWPSLFGPHDVALKHFRRYTPAEGLQKLQGTGLRILRHGGLFHALAMVRRLQLIRRQRPETGPTGLGRWNGSRFTTASLAAILRTEGQFSRILAAAGLDLPGLTWWALCTKP